MLGFCSLGDKDGALKMFVRFAHRNISKGDCCLYRFLSPYTGAVKKLLNLYLVYLSKSNGRLFIALFIPFSVYVRHQKSIESISYLY